MRDTTTTVVHVEGYLRRQARAAHNLGFSGLERSYTCAWLAFRLWRMELEAGPAVPVQQTPSAAVSQTVDSAKTEIGKNVVEKTSVS